MRACAEDSCADHAPNSWAKLSGIASIRWVRPVLTDLPSPLARLSIALRRCARAGSSARRASTTAITRIAVGTTSLLLCPRLTWSFGWIGSPASRAARWAITSLAFMLLEVPEPVWYRSTGNWSACAPPATAVAASMMASARARSSRPRCPLTTAADALTSARARTKASGIGRPEMRKLSRARWVCAPHRALAGTCSVPMLSCSRRKPRGAAWVRRAMACSGGRCAEDSVAGV